MRDLVISYFNEDLGWLPEVTNHRTFLYDKSRVDHVPKNIHRHVRLPNIGRESYTYLSHIIDNYDSLPAWTVFTQAWPFDHCYYFLELLDCHDVNSMINMIERNEWKTNAEDGFLGIGGLYDLSPDGEIWEWQEFYRAMKALHEYCNWPPAFFDRYPMSGGALMTVHRDAIHRRPLKFYKGALELHEEYFGLPWVFEVVWRIIFSRPKILL